MRVVNRVHNNENVVTHIFQDHEVIPFFQNDQTADQEILPPTSPFSKSIGVVMLNLRAKYHVSHAALNYIANSLQTSLELLDRNSLEEQFLNSFHQFNSQKKRKTYFENYLNFTFPSECIAGRKQVLRYKNGVAIPRIVLSTFYYISLRQTLVALFSNEAFFDLVFF